MAQLQFNPSEVHTLFKSDFNSIQTSLSKKEFFLSSKNQTKDGTVYFYKRELMFQGVCTLRVCYNKRFQPFCIITQELGGYLNNVVLRLMESGYVVDKKESTGQFLENDRLYPAPGVTYTYVNTNLKLTCDLCFPDNFMTGDNTFLCLYMPKK